MDTTSTHSAADPVPVPRIQTACPKSWNELAGNGDKRFCAQCSLHVHDASRMTRTQAVAMVRESPTRVCMRMEYDSAGQPMFRPEPSATTWRERVARWTAAAAAGLLAACSGSNPTATDPSSTTGELGSPQTQPGTATHSEKLGKVRMPIEKLGDVAVPAQHPATAGGLERLGEVDVRVPPPESPTPPQQQPR